MTENDHDHDELRRRLRDEGQASAPPGLAGDVMRQVRAEPRERRSWLRPVLVPLAAAVLLVAALVGISRIGGTSSSSSGSAAEALGGGTSAPVPQRSQAPGYLFKNVPGSALDRVLAKHGAYTAEPDAVPPYCPLGNRPVHVWVPDRLYRSVQAQLRQAAAGSGSNRVDVLLRPGGAAIRITCP